ncbi:MAG: hypothetical protein RMJ31_06870 [Nitrososphaerota archaeon]|nr:hypothetical protein [Nitrososphaerota archaeon]
MIIECESDLCTRNIASKSGNIAKRAMGKAFLTLTLKSIKAVKGMMK